MVTGAGVFRKGAAALAALRRQRTRGPASRRRSLRTQGECRATDAARLAGSQLASAPTPTTPSVTSSALCGRRIQVCPSASP